MVSFHPTSPYSEDGLSLSSTTTLRSLRARARPAQSELAARHSHADSFPRALSLRGYQQLPRRFDDKITPTRTQTRPSSPTRHPAPSKFAFPSPQSSSRGFNSSPTLRLPLVHRQRRRRYERQKGSSDESMRNLPSGLAPPRSALASMRDIAALFAGHSSESPNIALTLSCALQEWLRACERAATRTLSPLERHVFLANCLGLMRQALGPHATEHGLARVDAAIDTHIDAYVRLAATTLLAACGLSQVAEAARIHARAADSSSPSMSCLSLQSPQGDIGLEPNGKDSGGVSDDDDEGNADRDENMQRRDENKGMDKDTRDGCATPMAKQPGLDGRSLAEGMRLLQKMLLGARGGRYEAAFDPPHVGELINLRAQSRARAGVADRLVRAHRALWRTVQHPENGYRMSDVRRMGLKRARRVERQYARRGASTEMRSGSVGGRWRRGRGIRGGGDMSVMAAMVVEREIGEVYA